jgi:hypothetical protein
MLEWRTLPSRVAFPAKPGGWIRTILHYPLVRERVRGSSIGVDEGESVRIRPPPFKGPCLCLAGWFVFEADSIERPEPFLPFSGGREPPIVHGLGERFFALAWSPPAMAYFPTLEQVSDLVPLVTRIVSHSCSIH